MEILDVLKIIILGTILVILIATYLQLRGKSVQWQEFKIFVEELKKISKDYKGLEKQGRVMCITEGAETFSPIPVLIEDYKEKVYSVSSPKLISTVKTFVISPSNRKIIIAMVIGIGLSIFLFWNTFTLFNFLIIVNNWKAELITLFSIFALILSLNIGFLISYVIVKKPKDKDKGTEGFTSLEVRKLKEFSNTLVGAIRSKTKHKYYEQGIESKYIILAMFSKMLILALFVFSPYIIIVTILSIETKSIKGFSFLEAFGIIHSTFFFLALIYFLYSMRNQTFQKFENFSFYYIILGIFMVFSLLTFDWKFFYYVGIILICGFIGISALVIGIKNRRIVSREDYTTLKIVSWNLHNVMILNFIFIDVTLSLFYFLTLAAIGIDLYSLTLWVPLFFLLMTTLSLSVYLKRSKELMLDKTRIVFLNWIISGACIVLTIINIMIIYEILGPISYLLLLSQNVIQIVNLTINLSIFGDFENIFKNIKLKRKKKI